jgi:hypothetical protein
MNLLTMEERAKNSKIKLTDSGVLFLVLPLNYVAMLE